MTFSAGLSTVPGPIDSGLCERDMKQSSVHWFDQVDRPLGGNTNNLLFTEHFLNSGNASRAFNTRCDEHDSHVCLDLIHTVPPWAAQYL